MTIFEATKTIQQFYYSHKRLPSYQEMCSLFGFASKNAAFKVVKKLFESQVLDKDDLGKIVPGSTFFSIPVLGVIKAGIPDEAYQEFLDAVSIDHYLIKKPWESYALRVSGDSMIEAGINPGDIVIIEKTKQPKEGDIVVAQVDNEFTLKYLRYQNGQAYLGAGNKNYQPIYPNDTLSIFGTVVSVIRKYH